MLWMRGVTSVGLCSKNYVKVTNALSSSLNPTIPITTSLIWAFSVCKIWHLENMIFNCTTKRVILKGKTSSWIHTVVKVFQEMAYFNGKCNFVHTMKTPKYERTHFIEKYAHNVTQYEVKNKFTVPWWCLHHYKVRNYCLLMMFLMLEIDNLFNLSTKYRFCIAYNWKLWRMLEFDTNWAYSWAWGSLPVSVGCHPHQSLHCLFVQK